MDRIVLFVIATFFLILVNGKNRYSKKSRLSYIILMSIVLILASALRGVTVGADTLQYYRVFEYIKELSFEDLRQSVSDGFITKDPFYWYFQKAFQFISGNFNTFLGLVALLFFSSLGSFLYNNNLSVVELYISYIFYLGLFYGFYSITGIRQTIAVSFTLWAYQFIVKEKYIPFLLFCGIAYLFHASSIIFVISIVLLKIKNIRTLLWGVVLLLPLVFLFRVSLMSFVVYNIGLEGRFGEYLNEGYGGSIAVLSLYLMTLVGIIMSYRSWVKNKAICDHVKMFAVCVVGLPLMFISGSGMRATQYFSMSMFILVPYIVSSMKLQYKYTLAALFIFVLIVFAYHNEHYVFYWQ